MAGKYFRILAPLTRAEDVKLLKDAGADALYCGYVTEELTEKWPLAFCILNRRGENQSFEDFDTFKEAVTQALKYDLPVYITLNGLYTPEQYPLLLELVAKIESLKGVTGIIVADVGLLLTLKQKKFKKEICISTGGTSFNSRSLDFFRGLGAKSVVLERQLTSSEIEHIMKAVTSDIGIELFIINGGCGGLIDGYCTFMHCFEGGKKQSIGKGVFMSPRYGAALKETKGCRYYFRELEQGNYKVFGAASNKELKMDLKFNLNKQTVYGCRICDLYDLKKYPIEKSLKIVGRGDDARYIAKLVKLVSKALSLLATDGISKRDYRRTCRELFSKIVLNNKRKCTGFDCYFSPWWVKK